MAHIPSNVYENNESVMRYFAREIGRLAKRIRTPVTSPLWQYMREDVFLDYSTYQDILAARTSQQRAVILLSYLAGNFPLEKVDEAMRLFCKAGESRVYSIFKKTVMRLATKKVSRAPPADGKTVKTFKDPAYRDKLYMLRIFFESQTYKTTLTLNVAEKDLGVVVAFRSRPWFIRDERLCIDDSCIVMRLCVDLNIINQFQMDTMLMISGVGCQRRLTFLAYLEKLPLSDWNKLALIFRVTEYEETAGTIEDALRLSDVEPLYPSFIAFQSGPGI